MSELAQHKRPMSKKAKMVIGLTVTVLILAVVGVVVFMLLNNGPLVNPYGIIITNNTNTSGGLWNSTKTWVYRSVPISTDSVNLNLLNSFVHATPGSVCNSLTIGEHTLNNTLFVENGDITCNTLWIGQYVNSSGNQLEISTNGSVTCNTDMRLGSAGTGVVSMSNNAIMNVNNLTFNFYSQTTLAPATLTMINSALCQVQVLVMNTNSFASIDDQATLVVTGNVVAALQKLIAANTLRSVNGTLTATYSTTTNTTTVAAGPKTAS